MMLLHELVRILFQIEKLNMLHPGFGHLVLGQFPVPLFYGACPRASPTAIDPVQGVSSLFIVTHQDWLETNPLGGFRGIDLSQVTQSGQGVEQVSVPGNPNRPRSRPFHDERNAPSVIVKVLLALKTMSTDGHAMIRGVDGVGVVQLSHGLQLLRVPARPEGRCSR